MRSSAERDQGHSALEVMFAFGDHVHNCAGITVYHTVCTIKCRGGGFGGSSKVEVKVKVKYYRTIGRKKSTTGVKTAQRHEQGAA
jgi:hypothetical protein